jgi:acetolactate synthase-1/2/3 large subunit
MEVDAMYTGAEIVLETLHDLGVDQLFGYPGGAVIPLYDALFDQGDRFHHCRTAHEQGAVHAADGYSRASGKVGVCFVTSGPGATNTLTGLATAFMDSVPLVVISGQVPSVLLGKDSFQEIDITGISMPVTKHNVLVRSVDQIESEIRKAHEVALSGRPGPVLVDIPKDLFMKSCPYSGRGTGSYPSYPEASDQLLDEAVQMIEKAERPVIYAGGGVTLGRAEEAFRAFVDRSQMPVVNTLMGLGSYPRKDPKSLGMVGMHGFPMANMAVTEADLVIAVGARFSDRVIGDASAFAPSAKILHLDVDATEINKNIKTDLSVLGNLGSSLARLAEKLHPGNRTAWLEAIKAKHPMETTAGDFHPHEILRRLSSALPEATVVTDVGQHQMWTAQAWPFLKTRHFLTSGGLGTMGYGLGAAIGAQLARPKEPVILITGDGSFRMNANELVTVAEQRLPLLMVLFHNGSLGMVRQWQEMFQRERFAETLLPDVIDHVKLCDAYGIKAKKATNTDELNRAIEAYDGTEPMMIVCTIGAGENVLPIVPPGQPIQKYRMK